MSDKTAAKRGPKPLHGENMQAFHFRMTKAQREKLDRLGGAKWIRAQLEKAREEAKASLLLEEV